MLNDMFRPSEGTLARYARDLTADARAGRLEPVRCRDDEISRVIDILLRQGKNNPALVGAAGVGKTAVAEGLAQRIARGDVPVVLRKARVLALDHVALLAGTMYRGQYEERIRAMVAEASADPEIILFVDELHNLIGQGTAVGVAMDAANMLKPALVRGEFRVIGATTDEEYDRWICGDPALERRFQKVGVRELSAEQTMEILRARKERLERHHNVAISEEALQAAVTLTDAFVTDRPRPDRAIDALDEACAHTQAMVTYLPDTERLIEQRRELLRALEKHAAERPREDAQSVTDAEGTDGKLRIEEEDPLDRFARESIAALERFGADLEAAFGPRATERDTGDSTPRAATEAPPPRREERPTPARLAVLEAELHRRLVEEGVVVRGHDIARVVGVATGKVVQWIGASVA